MRGHTLSLPSTFQVSRAPAMLCISMQRLTTYVASLLHSSNFVIQEETSSQGLRCSPLESLCLRMNMWRIQRPSTHDYRIQICSSATSKKPRTCGAFHVYSASRIVTTVGANSCGKGRCGVWESNPDATALFS